MRILELADEPSAGIGRVGALAVVPCESLSSPANPLRGSGVSDRSPANPLQGSGVWDRSRCGAVRILELADRRREQGAGRRSWEEGGRREEGKGRRGKREREEGGGCRGREGGGGRRKRREEGGGRREGRRRQEEEEGGGGRRRVEEGGRTLLRVAVFNASHIFGRSGRDPPPLPLFRCKSVWPRMTEYKGIHPFKRRRGMKKGGVRLSPLRAFPNYHLPICRSSELIHTRRSSLSLPSGKGSSRTEGGGGRRGGEKGGEGRGGEGRGGGGGRGRERERERERERDRDRDRHRDRANQRSNTCNRPTTQTHLDNTYQMIRDYVLSSLAHIELLAFGILGV